MNVDVETKHLFHTWATILAVMNFKHIHERESHEVLLAILNKKKKLSFAIETEFDPTKQNSDVQINADADVAHTNQVVPIPCAKEATSELSNSSPTSNINAC